MNRFRLPLFNDKLLKETVPEKIRKQIPAVVFAVRNCLERIDSPGFNELFYDLDLRTIVIRSCMGRSCRERLTDTLMPESLSLENLGRFVYSEVKNMFLAMFLERFQYIEKWDHEKETLCPES